MLQLLAGVLSAEQRELCFAVMCGGRPESPRIMVQPAEVVRLGTGVLLRLKTEGAAVVTVAGDEAATIDKELEIEVD